MALPAFARRTPLLQQSIDIFCPPAHSSKPADTRTDRQTIIIIIIFKLIIIIILKIFFFFLPQVV